MTNHHYQKSVEVTGVYLEERFRKGEFVIGYIRPTTGNKQKLAVKGDASEDQLQVGCEYRFFGRWVTHPQFGEQLQFSAVVRSKPHSQSAVVRYLQEAPSVGPAIASGLWSKFGPDAIRILKENPQLAAESVSGLTPERAKAAGRHLESMQAIEDTTIELVDLLDKRGFPKTIVSQCIQTWGPRAPDMIRRNPYLLMRFKRVGFLTSDKMYQELGLPPGRLKRQSLAAWHHLGQDREGHTWFPISKAIAGIKDLVSGAVIRDEAACHLARRAKLLSFRRDEADGLWVTESTKDRQEDRIAKRLVELMDYRATAWPLLNADCGASEHQLEAVRAACRGPVGLLCGSPGTGKTFVSARIVSACISAFGDNAVGVAAPTNKAAVRLTELLQGYGIGVQAKSIHRMLGVLDVDGGSWTFAHDRSNPLPYRMVLIDESSMPDVPIMASLLDAIAPGTLVLFVGDTNQLPPVGHGAPLRDFRAAGVPCGELKEIRRNSGTIVEACAAIRDRQPIPIDDNIDLEQGKNLKLISASGNEKILGKLAEIICAIRDESELDPIEDVQIVVAVNTAGPVSRVAINGLMQRELNPHGYTEPQCPWRVGDKVVCLQNGFQKLSPEHAAAATSEDRDDFDVSTKKDQAFVANGEQGRVTKIEPSWFTVRLSMPNRLVLVWRGNKKEKSKSNEDGAVPGWDLAYAISAHKSQGSEYPYVIVPLDEGYGAKMVSSRQWVYTAISRAKVACFLIGKKSTLSDMAKKDAINHRKTFLVERTADYAAGAGKTSDERQPAIAVAAEKEVQPDSGYESPAEIAFLEAR